MKQAGEIIRRYAFNTLDLVQSGGRLNTLKEVEKYEIVNGVTPEYAARRLEKILSYASENCPFYSDIKKGAALRDFPVMTKRDYSEHYDELISDAFYGEENKLRRLSTSGSTGTPFTVLADPVKSDHVNMNFMAVLELNGFRLGMKRGEFRAWIKGKNTISRFTSFKNNLIMIDIANMGDEHVREILEKIRRERIQVLVAYSSAVTALVDYVSRTGYSTAGWDVEMIFTMGEALPAETRRKAAELFGITPVLSYGNNENGFIAVSLPGEDVYTIDLYSYHIEILKMDSDEPADEGEIGRIVVTDYYNRAFPMIRYDTGDTGKINRYTDSEGRLHAVFTEIWGRRGSLIYNTKGEPLSIHVFLNTTLKFEGILKQARCIQTGIRTYELILIPEEGAKVDEEKVREAYALYLGDDAEISVSYADALPVQQSGKTMVAEQRCAAYLK